MKRKLLFMIFALSVGVFFGQSNWAIAVPKLLIEINRGGTRNIGIIDADGKNLRIFTDDPKKVEYGAVWSPNGRQIAFVTAHIMLMDADGKNSRNLTEPLGIGFATDPAWSPDGRSLAFVVFTIGVPDNKTRNIYVVDLDGKNLKQLTHVNNKWNGSPVWSPDGSKIAYVSGKNQGFHGVPEDSSEIFVMDADGKNQKQLTKGPDFHPTWSPDRKKIAYVRKEGDINPFHLWVMDANGDNQHAIPIQNAPLNLKGVGQPLWLSDGRILFRNTARSNEIYTIDEDGKNLTLLFDLKEIGDSVTVTSWFDPTLARSVSPAGKQATTWGRIKSTHTERQRK